MTSPPLPPPSYPGTLKVFTPKQDGQVIYGEHANEWQEEIVAIEGAIGLNPEIDYQSTPYPTMSARLTHLEGDTVRLAGNQLIHGTKEFADTLQADGYLIADHAPVTFKYNDRQFYFSNAGIQGLDGASLATNLVLQPTGGQVYRGGHKMWDDGNDGPGSGLDADTLDGHNASDFLIAAGAEVISTTSQTINNGTTSAFASNGWQELQLQVQTFADNDAGLIYPGDGWFHIPVSGIYFMNLSVVWRANSNGWRGILIKDSTNHWFAHDAKPAADIAMYSSNAPQEVTRGRYLAAGTKLKPYVWQDCGGPLDIITLPYPNPPQVNDGTTAGYPTGMTVTRLL